MTLLLQYSDSDPETLLLRTDSYDEIVRHLSEIGVGFERWSAGKPLAADATSEQILAAYASDIARLQKERGYGSADVVRLKRDPADLGWAQKASTARAKFLEEHTHAEDEVRFFVEGSGMFCLHLAGKITQIVCERGDLLSVPAGSKHWFDMGTDPAFCAIRLFGSEAGWVADFTGDKLAGGYPSYDQVQQQHG